VRFRTWWLGLSLTIAATALGAPRAGLWGQDGLAAPLDVDALAPLLERAGYAVETLHTADLLDPAKLDPQRLSLLVMPYGPAYPIAGRQTLDAFLRGGGNYLALGGPSFTLPLVRVGGRFVQWDEFGDEVAAPRLAAEPNQGPQDSLTVIGSGDSTRPWQVSTPDLAGWAYATFDLPPLTDADAGLVFDARGGPDTHLLAIELSEQDGSRWKQVVDLSEDWRTYRLHVSGFASYASPSRNSAGDGFRPSQAQRLQIGFTKGMVGNGQHRFELRNLRFRRAAVPAGQLTAADVPTTINAAARRHFSTDAHGFERTVWPTCFGASASIELGWTVTGPSAPGDVQGLFPHQGRQDWRLLRPTGELTSGIVSHHAGPYLGSAWAATGHERLREADRPVLSAMLAELAAAPALSPLQVKPLATGKTAMAATLTVANRSDTPLETTLWIRDQHRRPVGHAPCSLPAGESATLTVPLPDLPLAAPVQLGAYLDGHVLLSPPTAALDVTASLRALADWFVQTGRDDAKFSGVSFIDNRGARTLLGAWRTFGDRKYLDAAVAWGNAMVAEQRADGGYRMGYGITSKGEACYVADGGEIAVGIACLANATTGQQRERFLKSLDAYMGYRDDFRIPTGGIGVGWCLHDYGQRPVVPLDVPTRIYAPERNTYTISCTLAAAYAHAHLRGDDPKLVAQCEADADWFMARSKTLYGAGCESFLFAHALSTSPERRELYRAFLEQQAIQPMLAPERAWWLQAGGRAAFNVEGLIYSLTRVKPDPVVESELRRSLWQIYGANSPTSIHRLIGRGDLNNEEWIYLCYSGLGLADVVQPMVTMVGFER